MRGSTREIDRRRTSVIIREARLHLRDEGFDIGVEMRGFEEHGEVVGSVISARNRAGDTMAEVVRFVPLGPSACRACAGTGRVVRKPPGQLIELECDACGGSGAA